MDDRLTREVERLKEHFDAVDVEREKAYTASRNLRRMSVQLVRDIQRDMDVDVEQVLKDCRELAAPLSALKVHFGFIEEALQEYAEAALTYALLNGLPSPTADDLGVTERSYLLGLSDGVSEFRRRILTLLRKGKVDQATQLFDLMDRLYYVLAVFDHTDAVLPLRRKQDQLRAVIERTRSDLTTIISQKQLEEKLAEASKVVS